MDPLYETLEKTDRVLRIYREREGCVTPLIQIPPLAQIARDDTGFEIKYRKFSLDQPVQIKGRLLRYRDIAYIKYNSA